MKENLSKKTTRQLVKRFYRERTERLTSIKLDTITATLPYCLSSLDSERADQVVTKLIDEYLASFEDWWQHAMHDSNRFLDAHRLNQSNFPERYRYEEELVNARNRLTLVFINQYCSADYGVDWRKLFEFSRAN